MWKNVENAVTRDAVSTKTWSVRVEIACGRLLRTSFAHTDQHAKRREISLGRPHHAGSSFENTKFVWKTCRQLRLKSPAQVDNFSDFHSECAWRVDSIGVAHVICPSTT